MKDIIQQFRQKFTIQNSSSKSGVWWIVPVGQQKEIASPMEVEKFIEQALSDQLNECLKDAYDEDLNTWDYEKMNKSVKEK